MQVKRTPTNPGNSYSYELLDDAGQPIAAVSNFLNHLAAREYSPNTISAYAYDLLHFFNFLEKQQLSFSDFTPAHSFSLL
jgi:site-specific recombinase XerD